MNTQPARSSPRLSSSRTSWLRTTTVLAALGAGAIVATGGCSRHEIRPSVASTLPAAKVECVTARMENLPSITEVTAVVRPLRHAQIAAKIMGAIEEMPLVLGQRVHTGDLLVKISAAEISARVTQAQAQLNAASRDLGRERDLLTKGASTADMVKGLEDRFSTAQAMLREAETLQSYASVRAPFDGAIARTFAQTGDLASPGAPLLELEGTADFQVEAEVPDSLAGQLRPDTVLAVAIPTAGATFRGSLTEFSPAADPNAHTVLAKIRVPAEISVRSGEFARVQIPGAPSPTLFVPATAVRRMGQMETLFVAEPGPNPRAVLRLVKTGETRGGQIEILSGVDDGERVVVLPPTGLREGQALAALP